MADHHVDVVGLSAQLLVWVGLERLLRLQISQLDVVIVVKLLPPILEVFQSRIRFFVVWICMGLASE